MSDYTKARAKPQVDPASIPGFETELDVDSLTNDDFWGIPVFPEGYEGETERCWVKSIGWRRFPVKVPGLVPPSDWKERLKA